MCVCTNIPGDDRASIFRGGRDSSNDVKCTKRILSDCIGVISAKINHRWRH